MLKKLIYSVAITLISGSVQSATFRFEDKTATSPPSIGALTSLVETQDRLTMTLSRPGSSFDLISTTGLGFPSSFGNVSLDPFSDTSATSFVATFSQPLTSISLAAGDFGGDNDNLRLQIYAGPNATGRLLGSIVGTCGLQPCPLFASIGLSSTIPFLSTTFIGGSSSGPNSVYYDNITAIPIPGPIAGAGLPALLALGGLLWARRRKAAVPAAA